MFFDLKIKYMASGIKTRTFGAPCLLIKINDMAFESILSVPFFWHCLSEVLRNWLACGLRC